MIRNPVRAAMIVTALVSATALVAAISTDANTRPVHGQPATVILIPSPDDVETEFGAVRCLWTGIPIAQLCTLADSAMIGR